MFTYKNLMAVAGIAALAFGLAACGDSDDGPSTSMMDDMAMDLAWDMLDGETVEAGTYTISSAPAGLLEDAADIDMPEGGFVPGSMVELGGYVLTCTGIVNCSVTVDDDGDVTTTGTIMVAAAAMMPDPMPTTIALPMGNTVHAQLVIGGPTRLTIAAGNSADYGGVRFICPAGGADCVIDFVGDLNLASASAPVGSGVADAGAIPNPVFAGSDAAGFLANEHLLRATRSNGDEGSPNVVMGRGFDANGDTYNDFPMPTELAAVGGVDGMAFTGAGPRRTQMINLYSTIGPGMEMPFADVYGPNVTPAMDEAFWSKIAFVTEVETLHRQAAGPYSGGGAVTYGGAAGALTCLSGICEIDPVGRVSGTGTWRFTATAGEDTRVADDDYIVFGWWQNMPTGLPRETQALWAGSDPFESANVAGLTGTATYTGGAAGHYEERKEGMNRINRGTFTGAATLTASFSEDRISGSITAIEDSANPDDDLPMGTRVVLRNTSLSGSEFSGTVRIDTDADQHATTGSWNGQFFGNGMSATAHPSSVAGDFLAQTGARTVQDDEMDVDDPTSVYVNLNGAFGATR